MMNEILQKDDPQLRKTAEEVPLEEIGGEKINKILIEMAETLDKCEDGVALAAPQIGILLRMFVISPKAFLIQEPPEENLKKKKESNKLIYINPVITKKSVKKVVLDEGCLSVRGIFGKIKRHDKVTITAYDERGNKFTRGASGLLAEIFQHETDHLDGVLFIDSAKDLVKIEAKKEVDAKKS
jgi:peptide deformylase